MGKGLANSLLIASREAFRGATPVNKISTPGYLQYLLGNNKPAVISEGKDDGTGYIRDIKIRYRTRGAAGKSVTVDDCSTQVRPAYLEYTVPTTTYRALGIAFEDDLIAQFEKDALAQLSAGTPAFTQVMKDVYEAIVEQANGIFQDINNDCLAAQVASFGKHVASASAAARTVNFALSNATNPLDAGMTMIMSDALKNEMRLEGASIIGSGLIANYMLQQQAKSADQSGVSTNKLVLPQFFYDPGAQAAWGANQFALMEKDAVQFVNVCRFRGAKAGQKGADYFMTMRLPITDSLGQGNMSAFEFDVQLRYRTCVGEELIDGVPVTLGRGWNVIISCAYQTVFIPSDSYAAADPLYLTNGTYRYTATNA